MIHAEGNMRLREYSTKGGKQIEIGVDDGGVEKVFRFSTTPWSVEGGEWVYKEDVVNAIKALDIDTSEIDGGLRTFLGDNWEDEYTGKGSEESAEVRSLERTIGTREERETEGAQGLPEYEVGAEEAGAV
jgi:hypothetical protein